MATTAPTSLTYAADYNQKYLSIYDIKDDTLVQKLHKLYGDGVYATDLFDNAGQVEYVPYDEASGIKGYEEQAPCPIVKVGAEISTGAAGANVSLQIHADSMDSNDNPTIRQYETISIPAAYQPASVGKDAEYWVSGITGTTTKTATLVPLNSSFQIATAIPVGTALRIGATMYAVGTGQPDGKRSGYATRTYYYRLVKDSVGMEGGAIAANYQPVLKLNGNKGLLSKALVKAEFDLKKQKAFVFMFGEENNNSANITQTSQFGSDGNVLGTKGVFNHAIDRANDFRYDVEPQVPDFETNRTLLESRGVTSKVCKAFVGPGFEMGLYRSFKEQIREYSGGSDLLDAAKKRFGTTIQTFVEAGIEYHILPVKEFSDPTGAGLNVGDQYSYQAPNSAIIIPEEMMTMKSFNGQPNYTMPNVTLAYVNHNGENRMNVIGVQKGMSGFESGSHVSNEYDGNRYFMMSHLAVIAGEVEKWILMRKR